MRCQNWPWVLLCDTIIMCACVYYVYVISYVCMHMHARKEPGLRQTCMQELTEINAMARELYCCMDVFVLLTGPLICRPVLGVDSQF
jgi:hypothetical protein